MNIKIKTEFIKLDNLLKFAGVAQTGGEAKIIITSGEIMVNNERESRRGRKIRPGDVIEHKAGKIYVS